MPKRNKKLKAFLDDANSTEYGATTEVVDKMGALGIDHANTVLHQAILDGIGIYEKQHNTSPSDDVINGALHHANLILDEATRTAISSTSEHKAMKAMEATIAIQTMLAGAIPFGYYLTANQTTGEAQHIIVSHQTGAEGGMYKKGDSIDGVAGGGIYISTDRVTTLTKNGSNTKLYEGTVKLGLKDFSTADTTSNPHALLRGRTQILVNGLVVATAIKGKTTDDTFTSSVTLAGEENTFTGTINTNTGAVNITFNKDLPEGTTVNARGYLNLEEVGAGHFKTPEIVTTAERYSIYASSYRAKIICSPEARAQFETELGIDPAFEGTMSARLMLSQENLYKTLNEACIIGKGVNKSAFAFSSTGMKTLSEQASDFLTVVSKASQKMAEINGSHGISHIYVNDKTRAIIESFSSDYFKSSELPAQPSAYRLGRLANKYEVYYSPKGLDVDMLLIGASSQNPAFNPFLFGDVGAPKITPASASSTDANSGYWVTGKAFSQQNPCNKYASSCAVITLTNA